jgi:SAM-dependent methyltransferase
MVDSKLRFADRVADYKKYRPSYPPEVISFIIENCQVSNDWTIADIGSGTGISSRKLSWGLKCPVYAVEPNEKMREMAELDERDNPFFHSVNGSAESTTLGSSSVNMVCAFQAFHWFNALQARKEFARILKSPQWTLLVWNDRITDEIGFLQEYEKLLTELPEYKKVTHKNVSLADIELFLGNSRITKVEFRHEQEFGWEGLKGRFLSSSYTPMHGTGGFEKTIEHLKKIFNKYSANGTVLFKYKTEAFLGQLS